MRLSTMVYTTMSVCATFVSCNWIPRNGVHLQKHELAKVFCSLTASRWKQVQCLNTGSNACTIPNHELLLSPLSLWVCDTLFVRWTAFSHLIMLLKEFPTTRSITCKFRQTNVQLTTYVNLTIITKHAALCLCNTVQHQQNKAKFKQLSVIVACADYLLSKNAWAITSGFILDKTSLDRDSTVVRFAFGTIKCVILL